MIRRLGDGEYERADVETKQSTLAARDIFLQTLFKTKDLWAFDLIKLFNSNEIPKKFLEDYKAENIVYFFLPFLLRKKPYESEISSVL
jgi:hypothetical protein